MAYLSQVFGAADDAHRRSQAIGDPLAAGASSADAGQAAPVAPAPAAPSTGPVDHNAIRSFFESNKDQGANVLGGLADSLGQRMRSANTTAPGISPVSNIPDHVATGDYNIPFQSWDNTAANQAAQAKHDASVEAAKSAAASNVAGLAPLKADVGQFGSMEGQQTLLAQGKADYSPGQNRLDAWLSGAATNQSPGAVNNVNAGFEALQNNAGIYDPADPNQKQKSLEDYLHGR